MKNVPIARVKEFEQDFLAEMELAHKDVLNTLASGKIDDEIMKTLTDVAASVSKRFE